MSTTVKMWAVFDERCRLIKYTLKYTRRESIVQWCKGYSDRCQWPYWKERGYTCRPVRVTIEEIEKPKTKNDE